MKEVNLSRRPFVSSRPLVRLATLLWLAGAALLAVNVLLYTNYWADSAEIRGQLNDVDRKTEEEEAKIGELDDELRRLDLSEQNARVLYLNLLIDDRTFPWSQLFDDLEDILPREVRLNSVRPFVRSAEILENIQNLVRRGGSRSATTSRNRRSSRSQRSSNPGLSAADLRSLMGPDEVNLELRGMARSNDALMGFVDALYSDPRFREPLLDGDSLDRSAGTLSFTMSVIFRLPSALKKDAETNAENTAEMSAEAAASEGPEGGSATAAEAATPTAVGSPDGRSPDSQPSSAGQISSGAASASPSGGAVSRQVPPPAPVRSARAPQTGAPQTATPQTAAPRSRTPGAKPPPAVRSTSTFQPAPPVNQAAPPVRQAAPPVRQSAPPPRQASPPGSTRQPAAPSQDPRRSPGPQLAAPSASAPPALRRGGGK